MKTEIKFGTSGWRGIIADDFTYENVRRVSQAISDHIRSEKVEKPSVIIGYDTRFLSDAFAKLSASVLAANGIKVLLCKRDTPTPVIAYEIIRGKLTGGINFTASHNPPNYNGIKYSPSWGGPALPETTKDIEERCVKIDKMKEMPFDKAVKEKLIVNYDPRNAYIKRIKQLVNFKALKKANIKVAADVLHGTAHDYLDTLLDEAGIRNKTINKNRDPLFDGHSPEPSSENLTTLFGIVKKESCKLGLATDGDADRFGIIDSDGSFITPNEVIPILLYHLNKTRGWTGIVARSVMTTSLIDKLADKLGIAVEETPVGFKYIGDVMVKHPKEFIIGGEESGGLTIRGHIPEKDGILACLLMAEAVAMNKKPARALLADIEKLTGKVYTTRLNFRLSLDAMEAFRKKLKNPDIKDFAGIKVKERITIDGDKFILDDGNSWIGFRLSGTEPVVRLYAESNQNAKLAKIVKQGQKFVNGK